MVGLLVAGCLQAPQSRSCLVILVGPAHCAHHDAQGALGGKRAPDPMPLQERPLREPTETAGERNFECRPIKEARVKPGTRARAGSFSSRALYARMNGRQGVLYVNTKHPLSFVHGRSILGARGLFGAPLLTDFRTLKSRTRCPQNQNSGSPY